MDEEIVSVPVRQRKLRQSSISLAGIKKECSSDMSPDTLGSDRSFSVEQLSAPTSVSSPRISQSLLKSKSITGSLFTLFTKKKVELSEADDIKLYKNKSSDSLTTEECNSNTTNSFSSDVSGANSGDNLPLTQAYNNSDGVILSSERNNSAEEPITSTKCSPSQELAKKRMSLSLSPSINAANTPPMSRRKSLILPPKSPVLSQISRKMEVSRGDNSHTFHNPIALLNKLRNQSHGGENGETNDSKIKDDYIVDDDSNTMPTTNITIDITCDNASTNSTNVDDTSAQLATPTGLVSTPSSVGSIGTPGRLVSGRRKSFMRNKSASFGTAELHAQEGQVPSVPPPPPPPTSLSPPVTILSTPDGRRLSIKALTPNAPPAPLPPPRPSAAASVESTTDTQPSANATSVVASPSPPPPSRMDGRRLPPTPPSCMDVRPLPPTPTTSSSDDSGPTEVSRDETYTAPVAVKCSSQNGGNRHHQRSSAPSLGPPSLSKPTTVEAFRANITTTTKEKTATTTATASSPTATTDSKRKTTGKTSPKPLSNSPNATKVGELSPVVVAPSTPSPRGAHSPSPIISKVTPTMSSQQSPLRRKSVSFGENMTSEFHPDDCVSVKNSGNSTSSGASSGISGSIGKK